MVKCWNCKHLITAYSGRVAKGKLFEKELRKCWVKGIVLGYYEITEERECSDFVQSERWPKTREPPNFSKAGDTFIVSA
jgi:hypothetical protein